MFYNVLKTKDVIEFGEEKVSRKKLMEHEGSSLCAVAVKKDEIIDTHTSSCDTAVIVVDGEIEIHFDSEKFKLNKGDMLMFKKDRMHKVLANKDSKFLLIKI